MGMSETLLLVAWAALFCGHMLQCGFALAEYVRHCSDVVVC
jgi:hypothetical protein